MRHPEYDRHIQRGIRRSVKLGIQTEVARVIATLPPKVGKLRFNRHLLPEDQRERPWIIFDRAHP